MSQGEACDVSLRASWAPPAQVLPRSALRVPQQDPRHGSVVLLLNAALSGSSLGLSPPSLLSPWGGFYLPSGLQQLRTPICISRPPAYRSHCTGGQGGPGAHLLCSPGSCDEGAAASPRPAGQHGNLGTVLDSSLALTLHVRLMTKSYRFLPMTIS